MGQLVWDSCLQSVCQQCAVRTMDKVVRSKEGADFAGPDTVHRPRLQVHQDGTGHVFMGWNKIK